jgi:hypothetical protein
MPNLREISDAILEKLPDDPDAVELNHVARDISVTAEDMITAIDVATREEQVYRSMLQVANAVGPDTPEDTSWLQSAAEDADRQGELADAAAKQVEALGRELARKVLYSSGHP